MLMVQSVMRGLTKAEQKVGRVVTDDPEFVMFASVTDVAERAGVGEATVIRLCRKLGYQGYQEFKLSIAQHVVGAPERPGGPVTASDSLETALQKIAVYNEQTLADTAHLLSAQDVGRAADLVLQSGRVYAFGVGSSGITAHDLAYRLMRIGVASIWESDAHNIAMMCALTGEDSTVIGISASGSTKDLIDALTLARRARARIICVTNHARSPITHLADAVLLTCARESPLQGGALGTKIAQMHVLDALTSAVSLKRGPKAEESLEKTAEAVVEKLL